MSHLSRYGRFDVWVEVDGVRAREFNVGIAGRSSTSYIISRVGAELAVYVQEYQMMNSAFAQADVYIEGQHVGRTILSPSKGPCCFAGSWVDDNTLRPFVFRLAKRKDSSPDVEMVDIDSGRVVVAISEVALLYKVDEDDDLYIAPLPLREWVAPVISETCETMERHSVVLSNAVKKQKYKPQNGNFHSMPLDSSNPEPVAIFEFIYGSEEFVFRELRKSQEDSDLGSSPIEKSTGATTYGTTPTAPSGAKKRSRANEPPPDSDSSSSYFPHSSDEGDPECSRCVDAGVACEPIGGKSSACWRCRRWKKGCDLPDIVKLCAEERENMRRFREVNGQEIKRVGHRRRHGMKRACRWNYCFALSSDKESSRSALLVPQSSTQSKQQIHDVDEIEDPFVSPHAENTNSSKPISRATQATKSVDRGKVQDARTFSCSTSAPLTHMNEDRSKKSLSNSDSVKPSRSEVRQRTLESISSRSDQVKGIVAANQDGPQGQALGAKTGLVKKCGNSGGRFEAQNHITESLKMYGSDADDGGDN